MSQQRPVTAFSRALLAAVLVALLAPSSAIGITRDVVLDRGKAWVDENVPYSQSRYYEGYRTDCSGFVSMCWTLTWPDGRPRSLATDTLDTVSERLGKLDLLPGDILLKQKTPTEGGHAVLFVAWLDPLVKSEYVTYEERGTAYGTVSIVRDYPENGLYGYYPYRYLGIEEDFIDQIEPVRGYDRYQTSVKASRSTFPTGTVDTVVVASGDDWPDALGGAALAGAYDAPVLLVKPDAVPSSVKSEMWRLGAKRAFVLGGSAALGPEVDAALAAMGTAAAPFTVIRIAGANRYETAAVAAAEAVKAAGERGKELDSVAFVASGLTFPDALAASPAAASGVRPILLSRPDVLPAATARALRSLAPEKAILLGAEGALSGAVSRAVDAEAGTVERIGGSDRYDTAARVAEWSAAHGSSWEGAGVATGLDFPDALSGGAALGERGTVLLLTRRESLSAPSKAALRTHAADVVRAVCFGGMGAVAEEARRDIALVLGYVE